MIYRPQFRLTLTRSAREGPKLFSQLRFGLVWIMSIWTVSGICRGLV
jgi:hypothetical protein